ncbi:74ddc8be-78dd-4104-aed5-fe0186d14ea7 [Thermothielavioides terrestris]|uniref:74ddc8be-78dd-4104-aed5-fe0186d14ea7 n=1 Tax=Thermothielavioides terrestris TaxID=2587410 RepID=A0A3S4D7X2_9PEZI|nr:74ddc8be-78dd-4104-aed5-fe0186d14ea7 [Thermothielavioides terrestris]
METYTWPDPTDALKDQDYQPVGNDAGASTLAPGHTDVAEWLPIAYHDKTTAYIEAETGDGASRFQFFKNNAQSPLAFVSTETARADLCILSSDGRATGQKLASSQDSFVETYSHLLQPMINTILKGDQLSRVIASIRQYPTTSSSTSTAAPAAAVT